MLATKLGTQNIRNHQILGAFFMLNPNIADKTKKNQKNQKLYPYLPQIFSDTKVTVCTKLGTQNIRNHQILGAFFMLNPNIADKTKKNQKNQKLYPYLPVIFQFLFLSSENSCAHMYMLLFYRDSAFLPCRSSTSIFTSIFLFHFPKKFSDFYKIFRDFSIFVSIKTCENS